MHGARARCPASRSAPRRSRGARPRWASTARPAGRSNDNMPWQKRGPPKTHTDHPPPPTPSPTPSPPTNTQPPAPLVNRMVATAPLKSERPKLNSGPHALGGDMPCFGAPDAWDHVRGTPQDSPKRPAVGPDRRRLPVVDRSSINRRSGAGRRSSSVVSCRPSSKVDRWPLRCHGRRWPIVVVVVMHCLSSSIVGQWAGPASNLGSSVFHNGGGASKGLPNESWSHARQEPPRQTRAGKSARPRKRPCYGASR